MSQISFIPLLIFLGLTIDQLAGPLGQPLVVAVTALSFFAILAKADRSKRQMMLICLAYASIGEVLLSLVWQVYDYRLGNLPLFVPPGHVLLFLLGLGLSPRLNSVTVNTITVVAALIVSVLAITGRDTFSAVLIVVFLASVMWGRERKLYATMFVLALAMELYGTWLGNWHWNAQVGRTGLVTLNPPIAAGAFYCALDLLVMNTMRWIGSPRDHIAPVVQPVQL